MEKQEIILVHKIHIGNMSRSRVQEGMNKYLRNIQRDSLIRAKSDIKIIDYIIPIKNGDSDIICIYPPNYEKQELSELIKELKEI